MKVILISSTPPPMGGIAKWTQRMLDATLPDGWTIVLVDDGIVGKRNPFGDNTGYNVINEIKRWIRVWYHLFRECRKKDAPIVHACPIATINSMMVNIVSASISRLCGKKHILHFRCTVPNLIKTPFQRFLLRLLCRLSTQIIALNQQTQSFIIKVTTTPVVIIPNFVETQEVRLRKSISEKLQTVLYVGGVTKEKGCDNLIEIAKLCPDIEFRLLGMASSEILNLAKGVHNVHILGMKNKAEVMEEMQKADVFFFLSRFWGEGFSNAVTEAMAAGLPCVVTDWAANADQVDNGIGGYVVSDEVVADSVNALSKLQDKQIRETFSAYNINKVKNKYASNCIIKQYVNIYKSLLNAK